MVDLCRSLEGFSNGITLSSLAREVCSAIVTAFFSPVWAAHWGTKFACWILELGFSIVAAHYTNKFFDPKAYCPRAFCKENETVLKEDYEKACIFLGVSPKQRIESIKV